MSAHSEIIHNIVWSPQAGPQHAYVHCPVKEVFFGGARGGGKTDAVLGKFAIKVKRYGKGVNGMFMRPELPMLDDAIERSHEIFAPIGGSYNEQKKTWRWPGGGRFRFRPLESIKDAAKYQGQNITDVMIEEAGLYASPVAIDRMRGAMRSVVGVPTQLSLTGNPGGAGQQWIKKRFIDPAPEGMTVLNVHLPNGKIHQRIFIPSKLADNKILLENDPDYVNNLYLVGNRQLVEAWLEGRWDAVEGAFFDIWHPAIHVQRPFKIPAHWNRFHSGDWGSAAPFSIGWWAVAGEDYDNDGFIIPRGAMVRYREWYGWNGQPNKGLKLTAEEVAEGILKRENGDGKLSGPMDPAAFAEDGGPSLMQRMAAKGVYFTKADNKRVTVNGRNAGAMGGWDMMRQRMIGHNPITNDRGAVIKVTQPMLYVFNTCTQFIRTVPGLQHDPNRPEDILTSLEDHVADETRYACMSRPWVRELDKTPTRPKSTYRPFKDEGAQSWRV